MMYFSVTNKKLIPHKGLLSPNTVFHSRNFYAPFVSQCNLAVDFMIAKSMVKDSNELKNINSSNISSMGMNHVPSQEAPKVISKFEIFPF